jgi:hypothetical protein
VEKDRQRQIKGRDPDRSWARFLADNRPLPAAADGAGAAGAAPLARDLAAPVVEAQAAAPSMDFIMEAAATSGLAAASARPASLGQAGAPPPSSGGGGLTARTGGVLGGTKMPPRWALFALLALGAVILVAALTLPGYLEEKDDDRYAALVADARGLLNEALLDGNPASRRESLNQASATLQQALAIEAGGEAGALKAEVDAELDAISGVYRLGEMTLVQDLTGFGAAPIASQQIVTANGRTYILDETTGRLILARGDGSAPEILLSPGDEIAGLTVDRLTGTAWFPWDALPGVDLLVRDASGQLFGYLPAQGILPIAFPNSLLLAGSTAMASYQGSLYLLDAGGNQVWRFDAVQGGFSDVPIGLVTSGDVSEADWLAVDDEVYMTTQEGDILLLRAGAEEPYEPSGLDRPLLSAGKPVLVGELVLVPDPANSRIVVFGRDGVFRQQLVSGEFTGLSAIAVDPASGLLYVYAGQKLFNTPLP